MEIPSYFLPRPQFEITPQKQTAFEDLWGSTPAGSFIDYHLPYPKWEYLSYLCDTQELVLHGSQNLDIDEVEPRQANDQRAFSNQRAIYATTDGIWVIYFAILDRKRYKELSLFNSCVQIQLAPDQFSEPLYFFSITHSVLIQKPWCEGVIYILPRQNFVQEVAQQIQGVEVVFPHWISTLRAKPAAKLVVGAQDFPFLAQIHGHNDQRLVELFTANPNEFPIEALEN